MLEQDSIKMRQVDKKISELNVSNKYSKEYKIKAIWDNSVCVEELESRKLLGLDYLLM